MENQLTCRICSATDRMMTEINEDHVCEMLALCGGLTVEQNDDYSKYLCQICTAELLVANNFRTKCIKVQNKMKQNLEAESQLATTCNAGDGASEDYLNIEQLLRLLIDTKAPSPNIELPTEPEMEPMEDSIPLCSMWRYDLVDLDSNVSGTFQANDHAISDHTELENNDAANVIGFDVNNYIEFDPDNVKNEVVENIQANEQQFLEKENDDDPRDIILPSEYIAISYNCDVCGAYFMQSITLLRHILNEHHSKTYFSCKKCKHCFTNSENYQTHIADCQFDVTKLKKKEEKSKKCTYCGKAFRGTYALDVHARTHTNEKPFSCSLCEKSFRSSGALTSHFKRHNGSSPKYTCELCEKSFSEKGNLRVHMRSHTGEKMHECNVCGKKFARVYLLTLHRRTHTGETPYKCHLCTRAFKQKCDFQRHMQIHMGNTRYNCNWCGQGFMNRIKLQRHVKEHENNVSESSKNINSYDKLNEIVTELELDKISVFEEEPSFDCNLNYVDFNRIMEMIEQ